jgi:hypothetical protein
LIDDKPIGAALNRNLGSPRAPSEAVEAELDRLIERRSRQKDPDEESELWEASVRAYEERRRQMARLEWHAFHCGQAARHRATLQALVEHHDHYRRRDPADRRRRAARYRRASPKPPRLPRAVHDGRRARRIGGIGGGGYRWP